MLTDLRFNSSVSLSSFAVSLDADFCLLVAAASEMKQQDNSNSLVS